MAVWALQDAKAKFSEVVEKARTQGPQEVTRHGRPVAVILSKADYDEAVAHRSPEPKMSFGQFLLTMPQSDDLIIEHVPVTMQDIDFGEADD